MTVIPTTTEDGEGLAVDALAELVDRLMKSGAVGYVDAVSALLSITASMAAMFVSEHARPSFPDGAADDLRDRIRRAMKDESIKAARSRIAFEPLMVH